MKKLLLGTTAYRSLVNDVTSGRPSHAYLLDFADAKNARFALKVFALGFFGFDEDSAEGRRLVRENHPDCIFYPEDGKKLTVEGVSALIADTALRPLELDKKLYVIAGFNDASALIQNKLLKVLEEPPAGVHFLLGTTSLAPVLDTVLSRVKKLEIPPFTESEIFEALERRGTSPLNARAARSCGGSFGAAENMVSGGWYTEVYSAAEEIFSARKVSEVGLIAAKYGDVKYKNELLCELQLLYFNALAESVRAGGESGCGLDAHTLIYALESITKAGADVRFNAYFQGLLYDFMLRIIEENDKWLKLQA